MFNLFICSFDLFGNHLVDFCQILQLFVKSWVALCSTCLKPFSVYFLFALQFREGLGWCLPNWSSRTYFWEFRLLLFHLNKLINTFCSKSCALVILFFSQVCFFYCIAYNSLSLAFRFLFSLISYLSCNACWSKLLALFLLLYSSNLYSKALFLCEISLTYFLREFSYYTRAFNIY